MENRLKHYFDTQKGVPEFAKAWKETEVSYQAANILLRIREEKQLTQSELATLTGKKWSYISWVKKGNTNIKWYCGICRRKSETGSRRLNWWAS